MNVAEASPDDPKSRVLAAPPQQSFAGGSGRYVAEEYEDTGNATITEDSRFADADESGSSGLDNLDGSNDSATRGSATGQTWETALSSTQQSQHENNSSAAASASMFRAAQSNGPGLAPHAADEDRFSSRPTSSVYSSEHSHGSSRPAGTSDFLTHSSASSRHRSNSSHLRDARHHKTHHQHRSIVADEEDDGTGHGDNRNRAARGDAATGQQDGEEEGEGSGSGSEEGVCVSFEAKTRRLPRSGAGGSAAR